MLVGRINHVVCLVDVMWDHADHVQCHLNLCCAYFTLSMTDVLFIIVIVAIIGIIINFVKWSYLII